MGVCVCACVSVCVCTCVRAEEESKTHVAKLEEMGYNVFFSPQPPVNRPQANKQERGRGAGGEGADEYAAVTVRVQEEEALVFQQAHILSSTGECATI